jgi:hypothetical protein
MQRTGRVGIHRVADFGPVQVTTVMPSMHSEVTHRVHGGDYTLSPV